MHLPSSPLPSLLRAAGILAVPVLLVLAAPGASPAQDTAPLASACATVDTTGAIPVCTALYPGTEAIRLPGPGSGRIFGAVGRGGRFVAADGTRTALDPSITFDQTAVYATTVYEATIAGGSVTALTPRLTVPAELVATRVFAGRMLTGKISRLAARASRTSPSFTFTPTLPILIRTVAAASRRGDVEATILNATRRVRFAGRCYPALRANRRNPLTGGFTRKVTIARYPAMHAPFDDEAVLSWSSGSSGMGGGFYPSLATLFGHDPLRKRWSITQHGVPWSGPRLSLTMTASRATGRC